jgi:hypothetical protein
MSDFVILDVEEFVHVLAATRDGHDALAQVALTMDDEASSSFWMELAQRSQDAAAILFKVAKEFQLDVSHATYIPSAQELRDASGLDGAVCPVHLGH